MTRLRMALDAIAAVITTPFTRPADHRAERERASERLADLAIARARTNGDKP